MTPILAFAIIAAAFGVGDIVAQKTKGIISSVLVAILLFLLFGGTLRILPEDLMDQSGLMAIIPTFGMGLILVNVGSMLNLNELRAEWKVVLVSLAGVAGVVILDLTLGTVVFGREQALAAIAPTAGGMAATMMLTAQAAAAGKPDLGAFIAAVMALQVLVGLPITSVCLRKAADLFIGRNGHLAEGTSTGKKTAFRLLPPTPDALSSPQIHMARVAVVAALALLCTNVTGIPSGVTYLVFGIAAAAIGIVDPGAMRTAGGEGLLMLATYASVTGSFVSMSLADFGKLLIPVFGLLIIAAVGVVICSVIAGKLLKWDMYLSIAVGLTCMFGYPVSYAVATEAAAGAVKGKGFSPEEEARVLDYVLPKMIISGVVSVSIASVIIAGVVGPVLFGG